MDVAATGQGMYNGFEGIGNGVVLVTRDCCFCFTCCCCPGQRLCGSKYECSCDETRDMQWIWRH